MSELHGRYGTQAAALDGLIQRLRVSKRLLADTRISGSPPTASGGVVALRRQGESEGEASAAECNAGPSRVPGYESRASPDARRRGSNDASHNYRGGVELKFKGFVTACILVLTVGALFAGLCTGSAHAGSANKLAFTDSQHGWQTTLEGSRAVIWRTVDGGASWTRRHVTKAGSAGDGPAPIAGRLAFASRTVGVWFWFCPLNGSAALLRTTNAGRTWARTGKVDPRPHLLEDVSFATSKVGWAGTMYGSAADGGSIAKTTNAGATWRVQKRIGAPGGFWGISCPTALSCYVLGADIRGDGVWATRDGGHHWVRRSLPGGYWSSIDFPTATTGWVVGPSGVMAMTTDRGRTWRYVDPGAAYGLYDISFCNAKVGYASSDGFVWRTSDGGATWVAQGILAESTDRISAVDCVDPTHAWTVDDYGDVFATGDGGSTWSWNPLPVE